MPTPSTAFKKGNTYAARRITANIEEQVRGAPAKKALDYLISLIGDDEAPVKERRLAADSILDRAYGKAVDRVMLASATGTEQSDPRTLTTAQLLAALTPLVETTPGIDLKQESVCVQASPEKFSDFVEVVDIPNGNGDVAGITD